MDTGSDFLRPEFLNILFFQQKNIVIFPYVDMKHLHTLELFTEGFTVINLDSTALNDLKEIVEFESSNTYTQNPILFFISNIGRDQLQQIMELEGIRCIINSNDNISDLANGSKFIFFNKKHSQFINFEVKEDELEFEKELIFNYEKELLQEQIHKIKIIASKIFRELNNKGDLLDISQILGEYDRKYWNSILTFTSNYYGVVIPDIKDLDRKLKPRKTLKDFSDEYEILITTNKIIGKEFVQLLHNYRTKKVNPQHLELEELYNPLLLYNYLRNHHWKEGIPEDFISEWTRMELSGYTLTESDRYDFSLITEKLGIPQNFMSISNLQIENKTLEPSHVLDVYDPIPSVHTNWDHFKKWLLSRFDNLEYLVSNLIIKFPDKISNPKLSKLTSFVFSEISDLQNMLGIYKKNEPTKTQPQNTNKNFEHKEKILLVDITNILNLDKNDLEEIKVSNIESVCEVILELGYTPKMWADASMKYYVDNKTLFQKYIDHKIVSEAPAGIEADKVVLKLAKKYNCKFLTNDLYRDYQKDFGSEWIYKNRLTCIYEDGKFIIMD